MNMFDLFRYRPQIIVKLTKDGLQVIIKLSKLRSALIEHFSIHKNPKLYSFRAPVNNIVIMNSNEHSFNKWRYNGSPSVLR